MQYRKFGKLDWKVSALGFGTMRLPAINGDYTRINERAATLMLHHAIELGVNYVDTAVHYHGSNSELFLGRALKNGYRDKIRLATKLFPPDVNEYDDFDKQLNLQLSRLQTDHIDFYLLHGINRDWWPKLRDLDVLEWAEKAIREGRIGHLGFSFHDEYPIFKEIIDYYEHWTFCMIQYNFMGLNNQAGIKGLKYAASKGMGVFIMEPLLGGRLANPPETIRELWESFPVKRTPAEWALQWLWNQPEVSLVLSGMNTMEQVKENIFSAGKSVINSLGKEEIALINEVCKKYMEFRIVPCTMCGYCMPCPNGIDIPYNIKLYNDGLMYEKDKPEQERIWYELMEECKEGDYHRRGQARRCTQCGECLEKCPQNIPVSKIMPVIHEVLGNGKSYDECPLPAHFKYG
jgi:predicted aldo/keto reductase-like oxidoreductase